MKPELLLHICCAPDEAWVVKSLYNDYTLHCFFCNPNIQPEEEYKIRLEEAKKVAQLYGVPLSADLYKPQSWQQAVYGLETTPEGGQRCEQCFLLRLRRTAAFCKELGWQSFTTVMSISPHKDIQKLNHAGETAAKEFSVIYIPFNFKKNNGFLNSTNLSKQLDLYRQDYCGCILSRQERDERRAKRA